MSVVRVLIYHAWFSKMLLIYFDRIKTHHRFHDKSKRQSEYPDVKSNTYSMALVFHSTKIGRYMVNGCNVVAFDI